MRICIYNSMRYKTFGGVGVAYIRELGVIVKRQTNQQYDNEIFAA